MLSKIKSTYLIALLFFLPFTSQAQTVVVEDMFWVIAESESAQKGRSEYTNSKAINKLFEQYGVLKYDQTMSFAKTPRLQQVYEIQCNCDIESLITDMGEQFPEDFSSFRRIEYENIELYDPADWMWFAHSNDWLWHLKKIEADKAWDITKGCPSVKVAIIDTDFDIGHPDLATKISPHFDPYDNQAYGCNPFNGHGTSVASYVAGETTEVGNTPNGILASVGFNTMMMGYKAWAGNYLQRALHASTVMDADILTSSAGGWTYCPDQTGTDELVVKEILNNGTTIIMPAGNGVNGTHNFCSSIDPNRHSAFFPLSPYYDERIILVTSTDSMDRHNYVNGNGINHTHSHYPDVDLCSPGYLTMAATPENCGSNTFPYYGSSSGTSFATPIVAGVASLMYCVNSCMTPSWSQDILKNTTDPVIDAANYPDGVGTGRVNAYKAVKAAQDAYSGKLDLFIKDRPEDFGVSGGYHWQAARDNSPNIWVRNQQDGFDNQVHQDPEYQNSTPVYVYVKVRNKSCSWPTGSEKLRLYWTKASSWSSWPQNWDGSQPTVGDLIGTIDIGSLKPGKDSIYEFTWTILDPNIHQNWATCLLARIENSIVDPITVYPGRIDDDVYFNNNIAMKNLTIVDMLLGRLVPINDVLRYPDGRYVYIGNVAEVDNDFDFEFAVPTNIIGHPITEEANVRIYFDEDGWSIFEGYVDRTRGIRVVEDRVIQIMEPNVRIRGVRFPAETRIPIYVGFEARGEPHPEKTEFEYHLSQYESAESTLLGGEHFQIRREEGMRRTVVPGGQQLVEGINAGLGDEPQLTLFPNPARQFAMVDYQLGEAKTAELKIWNAVGSFTARQVLDVNGRRSRIDLSEYPKGVYFIALIRDGKTIDVQSLVVME